MQFMLPQLYSGEKCAAARLDPGALNLHKIHRLTKSLEAVSH